MTAASPAPDRRLDRAVSAYLLWVGVAIAAFLAPTPDALDALLFAAIHLGMVLALVIGIRRHDPAGRTTWWVIVGGQVVYVAANVVWYAGPVLFGWDLGFPSVADLLYLVAYATLAVALWQLALARSAHRSSTAALEIATVILGIGSLVWLYLMAPYALDPDLELTTRLVAVAYPTFDLVLVSVVAALLLLPGRRPLAFWLLTAGLLATAVADGIYALESLAGTFRYGQPYFALWLVFYGLFGAAALHPSMQQLAEPPQEEENEWAGVSSSRRAWALPVALALPLFALAVDQAGEGDLDHMSVAVAVAVAIVLVAIRQARLLREVTERQRSEAALAASREAALESAQVKSAFLATMSHEIRTPMNAVIGMSELLADTELDPEQERYSTGILTAGETLLALIDDILDFSKIEAGEIEIEAVDFDLERTLEAVAELFTPAAAARSVDLYSYLHPHAPRLVRGDAGRVRQVLSNLVGNAVKFTEQGQVIVRAEPSDTRGPTTVVRFEVRDTGVGIDPRAQQRLFEPFTQADASSTRRYGGTGLGLAICRQLVELMGGEIGVDSQAGRGSTFWFTVPLQPAREGRPDRSDTPLRDVRLLVVDDDGTNREIIERQAMAWGMRTSAAGDAREALDLLTDAAATGDPIGVVLLDLQLCESDQFELVRRIREDGRLSGTHLAVLSSASSVTPAARDAGIQTHLRKPVRQSELYDLLLGLLLPAGPAEEHTTTTTPSAGSRSGTVLLVEDNPANQLVGQRIVERLGYGVEVAANGREALDALELRGYDAVLMDCQMPVMDGYEATRQLRERERGTPRRVPVIAMTASVTTGDRQRCTEAGMDDFVAKPVRPEVVDEVLDRWIATRSGPRPPPAQPGPDPTTDTDVLDPDRWRVLEDSVRGDVTALGEMITTFVEHAPDRVEVLRRRAGEGDQRAVGAAAHSLHGSAANFGADRLAAAARRVEERATAGEVDQLDDLLDTIDEELRRVTEAMRQRMA